MDWFMGMKMALLFWRDNVIRMYCVGFPPIFTVLRKVGSGPTAASCNLDCFTRHSTIMLHEIFTNTILADVHLAMFNGYVDVS